MKIICAFDSFKGCMTAKEACQAAASGLQVTNPLYGENGAAYVFATQKSITQI